MGSFNYTDFITGLPIEPINSVNQKTYVMFICRPNKHEQYRQPEFNFTEISRKYEPIMYPLFVKYIDYGKFDLDNSCEFVKLNDFAIDIHPNSKELKLLSANQIDTKELEASGFFPCVTSYDLYLNAVRQQRLIDQNVRQGVFTNDFTYREALEDRLEHFKNYKKELGTLDDPVDKKIYQMEEKVIISEPIFESENALNYADVYKTNYRQETQEKIYNYLTTKNNNYNYFKYKEYLLHYHAFLGFMEMTNTPFMTVCGMGSQETNYDQHLLKKQLELQTALRAKQLDDEYRESY